MFRNIVIDTNIWVNACVDKYYDIDCDDALAMFLHNQQLKLALDYQGEIEREYRDEIRDNRRFELRMKELARQNRKCWVDSKIVPKVKQELCQLGFHEEEDQVFVGTAMHSDKIVVTVDSDYGAKGEPEKQRIFAYMRDYMGLTVLSAEKFVAYMEEDNNS